jgi:transcriptional regulator with XRE-family HTH domain
MNFIPNNFGDFFNSKRRSLNLTLREFCRNNNFDPGNISKLERNLRPAPISKEKRLEYAQALGIKEVSEEWLTFCDLAAASAGKIPDDIMSNKELLDALPVLFRSIRNKDIGEEDLKKLIKSVKKELR